jgi:hypothetical protein
LDKVVLELGRSDPFALGAASGLDGTLRESLLVIALAYRFFSGMSIAQGEAWAPK